MKQSTQNDLFKSIANRLVGHWYDFEKEGGFVFFLCPSEGAPAKIRLFGNNECYDSLYTLLISAQNTPVIILGDPSREPELYIKVLRKGTLILQSSTKNIHIFERRPDIAFADALLESIEESC